MCGNGFSFYQIFLSRLSPFISKIPAWLRPSPRSIFLPDFSTVATISLFIFWPTTCHHCCCCDMFGEISPQQKQTKIGNSLTIFFNFVWNFISVVVNWILLSGRGPADATKTRTCATYYYYCKKNGLWLLDCHSRSSDFLVRAREFWQLFPSHSFLRNSWVFLLFFLQHFFPPSWSKIIRKTRGVFLDVSKRKILKTRNPKKENKKNAQNGSINKFWEKS